MNKRGFTLVEVMVATAVLSMGTVLIYEIFFKALDLSSYCFNYLNAVSFADEKMWQAQNDLTRFGTLIHTSTIDEFISNKKNFSWDLNYYPLDREYGLYKINGRLSWKEGPIKRKISRTAYALYRERK